MTYNSPKPKWLKDHPDDLIFKMSLDTEPNSSIHLKSKTNTRHQLIENLPIEKSTEIENNFGAVWYRPTDQGFEIDHLEIPAAYRGQGYGTKLLLAFIAFCQSLQKEKALEIWLEVSSLNLEAQKLYHKLGFQQVHIRQHYYADLSDAFVMTLKVGTK
jgi:ribosomal protein S18 acetylase RimI-like enzyme